MKIIHVQALAYNLVLFKPVISFFFNLSDWQASQVLIESHLQLNTKTKNHQVIQLLL